MKTIQKPPFLLLAFAISSPATQAATIVDDFNTYPGTGSDFGWVGGWASQTISNNGSSTITTTNPVNGGGNYIEQITSQLSAAVAGNRAMVRQVDSSVVSTLSAYTVSWDVRIDNLSAVNDSGTYGASEGFTKFEDRFHFMMNQAGGTGTDPTASWLVGAVGGTSRANGNWYFYDNPNTTDGTFDNGFLHDTTVPIIEGHTYSFTISADPSSRSYSATITDLDNMATDSATDLGFRNQTANDTHEYLVFGTAVEQDEYRGFSVDNLVITGVPEPSTYALFLLTLCSLCLNRRRA